MTGQQLRELRTTSNIPVKHIAQALGVHPKYIYKLEQQEHPRQAYVTCYKLMASECVKRLKHLLDKMNDVTKLD